MTPKSMLRHKDSASTLEDMARDRFLRVVPDAEIHDARRILLCTGKIGHELKREREKRQDTSTAVVFLDQLYPFPAEELTTVFEQNPQAGTLSGCRRSRPTWEPSPSSSRASSASCAGPSAR